MLQHAIQKAAAAASSLQYLVAKLYIGGPCDAMDSGSDGDALGDVHLETCEPHTHTSEGAPRRRFSEPGHQTKVKVCVCASQVAILFSEGREDRLTKHSPTERRRPKVSANLLLVLICQAKGTRACNTSNMFEIDVG